MHRGSFARRTDSRKLDTSSETEKAAVQQQLEMLLATSLFHSKQTLSKLS